MTNVFIAGSPRSGTTVLAEMFEGMGWDFGNRVRLLGNRMEDSLFQRVNRQSFLCNDTDSWWAQYPNNCQFSPALIQQILEDKKRPYAIKEPMLLLNWPYYRTIFDNSILVVTVRDPKQAIPAIMAFTGFPVNRAKQVWWRQMSLAYMWADLFKDVHFVAFPQMWGLEAAVEIAGGVFDQQIVDQCLSVDKISKYQDVDDVVFDALYHKLLNKTGRK